MPDEPAGDEEGTGSVVTFPRERSVDRPSHNLPLELTSFVGREREIEEAKGLLEGNRLLTLTGAGGSGKTRLALRVARDLVGEYEDGVWLVELAPLSDPALVGQAVARVLGVREQPDRPIDATLVDALRSKELLVVLDNCEHLVDAAARLVETMLLSCPHLRVLATSREPLGVGGEVNRTVPALSVPGTHVSAEELEGYESVRLFVERAQAVVVDFALTEQNAVAVARLCDQLDGTPLAIELAAARTRVLTVEQISQKLEDPLSLLTTGSRTAAPRHQTLRATLQWSYELLDGQERELLGRLSVFVGGWDLEAAEAVGATGDIQAEEVLDLLSRLVEQSMVVAETGAGEGAPRYRMLEPVRQYALELLEHCREAHDVRGRHAALFMAVAGQAHRELRGPAQVEWMHRLVQENDNLRAAIIWALSAGEAETAARLCWALWPFWWYRGNHREGRGLMEAALGEELSPLLRIRVTVAAEVMAYGQADNEAVVRYAGDLIELSHQVGRDPYAEAYANAGLGLVALNRGDFEGATTCLEGALPLFLESDEVWTAAQTHTWLGTVLLLQGDRDRATQRFEEGLALARQIGDRTGIYNALYTLAQVALVRGEHELATNGFEEGMGLSEEMGDRANVAYCLEGLATVAGAQGKEERSARLFGAAHGLLETIGVPVWTSYKPDRSLYERTMADLSVRLGEASFEAALNEGRAMTSEQAIEYALGTVEEPDAQPSTSTAIPVAPEPPAGSAEKPTQAVAAEAQTAITTAELRIFALGPARVELGERTLTASDFGYAKPRELLFYLLSYPEGRTKGQIGLDLWPEASPSQLRGNLHEALRRLRKALGRSEWIFHRGGRYTFERSLGYSFDVETFEAELAAAGGAAAEEPERAIVHLEGTIALYRGEYLEDSLDWEWAAERREELARKHRRALLSLGGLHLEVGRHAEAASAYRKAVSRDEYLEGAHRGLMRSYALMGERGRALEHYRSLVGVLLEGLGTTPAPETRELYEELRGGERGAR